MRQRKKTWAYYGIDAHMKENIIADMRKNPTQVYEVIKSCNVPHGITANVIEWILNGTSYYKQYQMQYIPICGDDFYGWVRKVVATYYKENEVITVAYDRERD